MHKCDSCINSGHRTNQDINPVYKWIELFAFFCLSLTAYFQMQKQTKEKLSIFIISNYFNKRYSEKRKILSYKSELSINFIHESSSYSPIKQLPSINMSYEINKAMVCILVIFLQKLVRLTICSIIIH